MPLFLLLYLVFSILLIVAIFVLSYKENGKKSIKTALTVIYVIEILFVIFATGCLEVKYSYSRLFSSVIAAGIILGMYCADTLGERLSGRKEEDINL